MIARMYARTDASRGRGDVSISTNECVVSRQIAEGYFLLPEILDMKRTCLRTPDTLGVCVSIDMV
jgi:hypothetical protein